jgi:hypothetical protein
MTFSTFSTFSKKRPLLGEMAAAWKKIVPVKNLKQTRNSKEFFSGRSDGRVRRCRR